MNTIGVIVADAVEAGDWPVSDRIKHRTGRPNIIRINKPEQSLDLLICGIGKVNAALGVRTLIDASKPMLVINIGSAGGIDASVAQGDIVVADAVGYIDFSHTWLKVGYPYTDIAAFSTSTFASDKIFRSIEQSEWEKKVHRGFIGTADTVLDKKTASEWSMSMSMPLLAADMECAAIAHACAIDRVPFACVKMISDDCTQEPRQAFIAFRKMLRKNMKRLLEIIFEGDNQTGWCEKTSRPNDICDNGGKL